MKLDINVISPEEDGYEELKQYVVERAIPQRAGFAYNEFVRDYYNPSVVSALLTFDLPKSGVPLMKKQLEARGLAEGKDYSLLHFMVPDNDELPKEQQKLESKVTIEKLSTKAGQILVSMRGKVPKGAAQGAPEAPAAPAKQAAPAKPVAPAAPVKPAVAAAKKTTAARK